MNLKQIDTFHKTKAGFAVFGIAELVLLYVFGSLALDSGSLLQWVLTLLLLIGVLQNFGRLLWSIIHDRR